MNSLLSSFCLFVVLVGVHGIGYYDRDIARTTYWLLANNLDRTNGSSRAEFWAIVNNEKLTKKEVLIQLSAWTERNGVYMKEQFERMMKYEKQLYETAEEFSLELVHTAPASELARRLWRVHADRELTWKQTCRRKNQMIRLAGKTVQNELKLQLNSWCLPKKTKKQSSLVP